MGEGAAGWEEKAPWWWEEGGRGRRGEKRGSEVRSQIPLVAGFGGSGCLTFLGVSWGLSEVSQGELKEGSFGK